MINNNTYVKEYADNFSYKQLNCHGIFKKETYVKLVDDNFIVIESIEESKYVNFFFNKKTKTFKKSDLLLSILENIPVAWEQEKCQ
jgi:hypothetical protein